VSNDAPAVRSIRTWPGITTHMPRGARSLAAALVLVVLVACGYLVLGPARGAREDINTQKHLIAAQLATIRAQLQLQKQQLEVAKQQLKVAEDTRGVAQETLAHTLALESIAAQTRDLARSTDAKAGVLVDLSRQLLALARLIEQIARDTDRHAASIDRKTGTVPIR
jgi:hypothetical protein